MATSAAWRNRRFPAGLAEVRRRVPDRHPAPVRGSHVAGTPDHCGRESEQRDLRHPARDLAVTLKNVRRQWRQARKDTGLEWVTPHPFRKTVATLIDKEADTAAADQLGHGSKDVARNALHRQTCPRAGQLEHPRTARCRSGQRPDRSATTTRGDLGGPPPGPPHCRAMRAMPNLMALRRLPGFSGGDSKSEEAPISRHAGQGLFLCPRQESNLRHTV
jgi:hypothetical protein